MWAYVEQFAVMSRASISPTSNAEIARRLRLTRLALSYTQGTMARLAGSSSSGSAWNNYEKGSRRISIDMALNLCQRVGLTLDWIYRGNLHSLPADIAERIQLQIKKEADDRQKPKQSLARRPSSSKQ